MPEVYNDQCWFFTPISSNVFSNSVSLTTMRLLLLLRGHGSSAAAVEGSVCLSVLHCRSVRLRSQKSFGQTKSQRSLACHHQLEPVSRSLLLTPRSFFILCTDKSRLCLLSILGIGKSIQDGSFHAKEWKEDKACFVSDKKGSGS